MTSDKALKFAAALQEDNRPVTDPAVAIPAAQSVLVLAALTKDMQDELTDLRAKLAAAEAENAALKSGFWALADAVAGEGWEGRDITTTGVVALARMTVAERDTARAEAARLREALARIAADDCMDCIKSEAKAALEER